MNKTDIFKSMILAILAIGSVYYFSLTPFSSVSGSSFFILVLTVMMVFTEIRRSKDNRKYRTIFQVIVDRSIVSILTILSMDVLYSLFRNGF